MRYAIQNGKKVHIKDAEKGSIGQDCWLKDFKLKACKGDYLQYWKYVDERPILPRGYENETEWHIAWKSLVKDEYCEVICGVNNEHRADIKTLECVIELQYSHISLADAKERTKFYKELTGNRIIWIINCYGPCVKGYIKVGKQVKGKNYYEFEWKRQIKWVVDISELKDTHVYLDISINKKSMLRIWRHENKLYCFWEDKQKFYNTYLKSISNDETDIKSAFENLKISDYI